MLRRSARFLFALLVLVASEGKAQAPLVVEVRGGALVPVAGARDGLEGEGELGAGGSFGVTLALERSDGWHLYLGFSQHRIDAGDGPHVSTAWDLGARLDLGSGALVPWVRAGLTVPRVELSEAPARPATVTRPGIGGEVGAGVRFPLGGRMYLQPAVRFGAVDTELPDGPVLRLRYAVLDAGVVIGF